jgi:hypothetical protein
MRTDCRDALAPIFQRWVERLKKQAPVEPKKRDLPKRGIYLLIDAEGSAYVGIGGTGKRALEIRVREHFDGKSSLNKRIADEIFTPPGQARLRGREKRRTDAYRKARHEAKARIEAMELRVLPFADSDGDADDLELLEMYAAHVLKTRYNVKGGHLAEQPEQ